MNRQQLSQLMMLYAAGLCEPGERVAAERLLSEGRPDAVASLAEAQAVLGALASTVRPIEPSAEMWESLETQIELDDAVAPESLGLIAPQADPIGPAPAGNRLWPIAAVAATLLLGASIFLWQREVGRADQLASAVDDRNTQINGLEKDLSNAEAERRSLASSLAAAELALEAAAENYAEIDAQRIAAVEQRDTFREALADAEDALDTARQAIDDRDQLLRNPEAVFVSIGGTEAMPNINGRAVLDGDQVRFRVNDLDPPADDQTYQAWLLRGNDAAPLSLGIFATADGQASYDVDLPEVEEPVIGVAISLERAGGNPTPTTVVAAGLLPETPAL